MVGRVNQVLRSQCRCMGKFVRRIYHPIPVAASNFLFQNVFWRRTSCLSRVAVRVSILWLVQMHIANLLWLDRVVEMQSFVFELISSLKFEATDKTALIRRENCLVMLPMVGDEEHKGNQLPLRISIINHSD